MKIDYTAAKFWMDLFQIVGIVMLGIYTWWQGKNRATQSAIDRVDERLGDEKIAISQQLMTHSDRLFLIEKRIESLPQDRHISELHTRINSLNREMGELGSTLEATNALLKIHQEYLMSKK